LHNNKHPDQLINADNFIESNKKISGSFDHMFTLADDVNTLLDNLDKKNKKKAIVTLRGPNSLPRVLELFDLTRRFDAVVHGQEATVGKPYPEAWAIGMKKLGILASRSMVVGDLQSNDILPAKGLGATAVLVKDGELDPYAAQPNIHVRNLRELALKFER
jgi:FMN phosphatase YigB (HAD superfamily)